MATLTVEAAQATNPTDPSLQQSVEHYLIWHRVEGHSPMTIAQKEFQLNHFLAWLKDYHPEVTCAPNLSSFHILAHLEKLRERNLSPYTVRNRLMAIKAWCAWMVQWGVLAEDDDPCRRIKPIRARREPKGFIDSNQFARLLQVCTVNTLAGARRAAMLWIMVTTGLRRKELHGLHVEDLDWKTRLIHVRHTKGNRARWAPFVKEAQKAVLQYLQHRGNAAGPLWVRMDGRALSYSGIWSDLRLIMNRAGVQVEDRCHVFRRTWAANAVRQGIPRQYTMAIAGWSTPTMMDHYVKAMEREQGAIEAFRDFKPFAGG